MTILSDNIVKITVSKYFKKAVKLLVT